MIDAAQMLTIRIPLKMRKRGGRRTMISPDVLALAPQLDVILVTAPARVRRWRWMLEEGIPRSRHNPKLLWVDDTEVVWDLITVCGPVPWHILADEASIAALNSLKVA